MRGMLTEAEREELAFLEEYLRDKPRLEAERNKACGISTATPLKQAVVTAVRNVQPQPQ
jgi:hypothetical protein